MNGCFDTVYAYWHCTVIGRFRAVDDCPVYRDILSVRSDEIKQTVESIYYVLRFGFYFAVFVAFSFRFSFVIVPDWVSANVVRRRNILSGCILNIHVKVD